MWSLHRGSNSGPRPYQGRARSTELRRRCILRRGESPKPDSNRRPSAYKADALAGLSYQGVVVATRDGAIACREDGIPPVRTAVTRAINSALRSINALPRLDSNQEPTGSEPVATTSCATGHCAFPVRRPAASLGLEPRQSETKIRGATNYPMRHRFL